MMKLPTSPQTASSTLSPTSSQHASLKGLDDVALRILAQNQRQRTTKLSNQRRRANLLVFIKILLDVLAQSGLDSLAFQVRLVVSACTQLNRQGDPSYANLSDSLESHLLAVVGEDIWRRTQEQQKAYLAQCQKARLQKQIMRLLTPTTSTGTAV